MALERQVRLITNFAQGYTKTTDADRATIGITVRDTSKTPSPTPTSAPVVQVESGRRLTHRLRFTDAAAPTRRGKPPGTIGAEVWLALTPPPVLGHGQVRFVQVPLLEFARQPANRFSRRRSGRWRRTTPCGE